jgi:WD40 repeat protein/AAA+ ATPase superfamily predicted ATPase
MILVRCNYTELREKIVEKLNEQCPIPCRQIFLPASVKTLYSTIEAELGEERPSALMVFGLETVTAIDQVLTSTNYVREEFKNNFPFPVVLWVTDKISKKLIRLVTDIESWTTTVEFSLTPKELLYFQKYSIYRLFLAILDCGAWRLTNSAILGASSAYELESTRQDLQNYGISLEPTIEASLKFIRGREEYANKHIDEALQLYQQSLNIWQNEVNIINVEVEAPLFSKLLNSSLLTGTALFHIGLCYRHYAEQQRTGIRSYLIEAKNYFQQCINSFNRLGREDLVAQFINQIGEILQDLEDWDGLWDLAVKARRLHQDLGESVQVYLAQDYGFLAQVSLNRKEWTNAKELATIALEILAFPIIKETECNLRVNSQHKSLYLLILAIAEYKLEQPSIAVQHLETARRESFAVYNPSLYLRVLEMLQQLYFEGRHYLEAFKIKQEYRQIEHTYRFRAFIGAGRLAPHQEAINPAMETALPMMTIADEITVSGRELDLNRLLKRMSSTQHKLTVIYGQSGVGKSSLVISGLVPALQPKTIDYRTVLPLVLQVYKDWSRELIKQLSATVNKNKTNQPITEISSEVNLSNGDVLLLNSEVNTEESISNHTLESVALNYSPLAGANRSTEDAEKIINLLRNNAEQNKLLTVIIFDQFEEFFFLWKEPSKRQEFFEFLRKCLNIPFVKVILSIREDYLHYLLEFSRPKTSHNAPNNDIMSDILNKDILFYLGNFSPADAGAVIKKLTERSQFNLEPALIDELVKDLAEDLGEVRPIELQIVGAQLQEKEITTLAQYQKLGTNPKQKLVEQFLEEVVKDCGPENERAVRRVLYLLTDENDTRPLKNRAELATDLATFQEDDKLDLVLELLVKSGLVFRWTEVPVELYQLVHDYLVAFIRQHEELERQNEFAEMQKQDKLNRAQIEKLSQEKELAEAKEKQREAEEKLHKNQKKQLTIALIASVVGVIAFSQLSWFGFSQAKQAEIEKQNADKARISALESGSEVLLLSSKNDPLRVLVASVKLGKESLKTQIEVDTKNKITERLRQVISGVQESNSFEGHGKVILGVTFSPDGNIIASASADKTVRLWSKNGQAIGKPLSHSDTVVAVSFSPDGQTIATASADKTVKLWRIEDGAELATFKGHEATVTSVSFSPNGETIATASYDKTVRIWNKNGVLLGILTGHKDWVLGVSFSPDGKTIASASADKTLKLWNLHGKEIKTFTGHSGSVYSVSFSPDGKTIATASADNTVKLWNLEGKEIKSLKGHNNNVLSVSFSRDGETIVSGSADDTIKLWNTRTGELLNTFRGHQDDVRSVSFGRDGTIVSGSDDKTIKIWQSKSTPLSKILAGHGEWIYGLSFSPDGKTIASGSADQTLKIWRNDGTLVKTISANQEAVNAVSFSPKKNIIAAAGEDKTVKLWNLDGQQIATLKGHDGAVFSVTFSPDGNIIATASDDKTVKLWNLEGMVIATLRHGESVNSVSFSPKGKFIASASEDKTVKLWRFDGKDTSLLKTLKHNESVNGVSFSPDGNVIASVSNDKTFKLWDLEGNLLQTLNSKDRVIGVNFSADGKLIATANADNTVNLWSFTGRKATLIKTIQHTARIITLSFSPDSKILAFAGRDKTVTLLPVDNLNLNSIVDRGCDWLQDYLRYNPMVSEEDHNICQSESSQPQ